MSDLLVDSATVGSSSANQVPIVHAEVSEQALLIDVRGDDFWVQNLNPYSIYVGMEEVTPNGWSPCELGEPIQLTKSVSLSVVQEEQVQKTSARMKMAGEAQRGCEGTGYQQVDSDRDYRRLFRRRGVDFAQSER